MDMFKSKLFKMVAYFLFVVVVVLATSRYIYLTQTKKLKDKLYIKMVKKEKKEIKYAINENLTNLNILTSFLSSDNRLKKHFLKRVYLSSITKYKDSAITKAIISNDSSSIIDISNYITKLKKTQLYSKIRLSLIDKKGIVFKQSIIDNTYDILIDRPDFEYLLKYPKNYSSIEIDKYGAFFSSLTPIFSDYNNFLGYLKLQIPLDDIEKISNKYDFSTVIMINEKYTNMMDFENTYTKTFINNFYIANKNADKYLLKYISHFGSRKFYKQKFKKSFIIDNDTNLLYFKIDIIDNNNNKIGKIFIFKDMNLIDYKELENLQNIHIIITIVILFFVAFIVILIYLREKNNNLVDVIEKLEVELKELEGIKEEIEFVKIKMENLFDAQPNIMVMHNGREITQGNKRFMGFFNRFGSFENFKQKHKCVSELFEEYDGKNYISNQYIKNKYWIDYMLENPRIPYKTVMSIDGDPHHFYIKFNEMKYTKYGDERIIFIAFVDFTADFKLYKDCLESKKIVEEQNIQLKQNINTQNKPTKTIKPKINIKKQ